MNMCLALSGLKKILFLLAIVTMASLMACGDDNDDFTIGEFKYGDFVPDKPISGVGPGISISEALATNIAGPLLINGLLHVENNQARLCETLAESFPPQCAGKSLKVIGLAPKTMDGLTSEGSVTWSDQPVQVLGTMEGDVLTVSRTVR